MAYFFITDDNKIYAGGGNYQGQTGTNTSGGSSSYNYSLYPPREIIYETKDGTILDGSMVKSIAINNNGTSQYSLSLLLTKNGEVFACGGKNLTSDGTQHKIFNKISVDNNGLEIPPIEKVFAGSGTAFLLTKNGVVYSCGSFSGRLNTTCYDYGIVSTDIEGNQLPPIADISTNKTLTAFITKDGEVYTFGSSSTYSIHNEDAFTTEAVYFPKKTKLKNIVKVVVSTYGFVCLDRFGQVWINGYTSYYGYNPYSGKYYDNNSYVPYINLNKLNENDIYMQHYNDNTKYPLPKKFIDVMRFNDLPVLKYLDENDNINILSCYNTHKYFGAGTTPSSNKYFYNHKGSTGIWDFENTYNGIYNLDDNGIATLTKEGKLYVSGGKGTTGSTSDRFTSAVVMPGTEDLTITKVFGSVAMNEPILKDELYPMPDVTKSKIKIQTMA